MLEQGEGAGGCCGEGMQPGDAGADGAQVLSGALPAGGGRNEQGPGDGGKTALVSMIVSNKMSHPGPLRVLRLFLCERLS